MVQALTGRGEAEDADTPNHLTESRWQARCAVLSLLATFLLHSPQVRPGGAGGCAESVLPEHAHTLHSRASLKAWPGSKEPVAAHMSCLLALWTLGPQIGLHACVLPVRPSHRAAA